MPVIKNAHLIISEIAKFFGFSPKRQALLERVVDASGDVTRHELKDVCRTRWIQRIEAYEVFSSLFPVILTTLQAITDPNEHQNFSSWSWDAESVTQACGFIHNITSPAFLVSSQLLMAILSLLRVVTVKLHGRSNDILKAYELVSEVHMELSLLRQNVDDEFSTMFQEIVQRAREFGLEITVPRTVGKQCHRLNTPHTTVE
jgi:AraC-like DNA-binding protein